MSLPPEEAWTRTKPMCHSKPPQVPTTSRSRRLAGHPEGGTEAPRRDSGGLRFEGAATRELAAGIEAATRALSLHVHSACLTENSALRRIENEISRVCQTELQQLARATAAKLSGLRKLDSFLEAEQERLNRLAEIASPHLQRVESLNPAANAIQSIAQELNRPVTEAARRHSQMLQQATTNALASQTAALRNLYTPAWVHAVPASPTAQPAPRTGRGQPRGAGQPVERHRAKSSLLIPHP